MEAALLTLALAIVAAAICWTSRKFIQHETALVELRTRVAAVEEDHEKHVSDITVIHEKLNRLDGNIIKIATKLNVEVTMPGS